MREMDRPPGTRHSLGGVPVRQAGLPRANLPAAALLAASTPAGGSGRLVQAAHGTSVGIGVARTGGPPQAAARPTRSTAGRPRKDRFAVAAMLALAEVRGLPPVNGTVQRGPMVPGPVVHAGRPAADHRQSGHDKRDGERPWVADRPPSVFARPGAQVAAVPADAARTALHAAHMQLSADGRLVLAALSDKIERQMTTAGHQAKAELTLFAASTLLKKERAEGPVVLSADQRRAIGRSGPVAAPPSLCPAQHREPGAPRLNR